MMAQALAERCVRGRVAGDGVELAYGRWAGPDPIVAIHGLTASHLNFIGIAERLDGRRGLLAMDLRGRGDSDKPGGPYGLEQHARDVAAAMRNLGLGPSVVIGHSMGAYVAAALVAHAPELVSGVVLLDGGFPPLPPGTPDALLESLLAPLVARLAQRFESRQDARAYWQAQPSTGGDAWNPWMEAYVDYDLGGEPPSLTPKPSGLGVRRDFFDMARRDEVAERLRQVSVPLLMIRAEGGMTMQHPPVMPELVVRAVRQLVPHAEDILVPGVSHYTIAMADPGASRVAELLLDFARRC
jgi:pimeloyl-ACP methyl ester carboxylesterase